MHKTLRGIVTSTKLQNTVIVEVSWRTPHPVYKKLLKRSKKYKVDPNSHTVFVGDHVKMEEMRKVAKGKYFKIIKIIDTKQQNMTEGETK